MYADRRYVQRMSIDITGQDMPGRYPFTLPVVKELHSTGGIQFDKGVTFLTGENGSGKSTLIEALAVAAGMNPEGGSQNYGFSTRSTESELGNNVSLTWGVKKPKSRFFLRAESFYNLASATEQLGAQQIAAVGGVSLHERSHGESFVDLMKNRFYPEGFYIMDEPESALSPRGCMAVVSLLADLVDKDCQLVIATHSPILLSLPQATIYQIDDGGVLDRVHYDDASPVRLTRAFLADPTRYLQYLI